MAKDLTGQKFPDFSEDGVIYPDKINDSPWQRLQPLLSVQELKTEQLFGIPLYSFFPNPVTGKRDVMTDDTLAKIIIKSVARVEELSGCLIAPSYSKETYPFDRNEYDCYGYMRLMLRPITSLVSLNVLSADRIKVFITPVNWISVPDLVKGRINIQPMGASGSPLALSPTGQAPFLLYMQRQGWIPAFWSIECTVGFKDMMVPTFVSDLVGMTAALEVLSLLGATYGWMTGGSLGIDGLSQSSSGPGPALFQTRMAELKENQQKMLKKFRKYCGLTMPMGAV